MTRAMKWAGSSGSTNNVGSVEYQYCLACDGALSKRFVYAGGSNDAKGALESGQRYEYDGLNLLRVDEIYGSTLSESGPWRKVEISTHQPGQLGALLHKRVYKYSSATSGTPSQTKDFTYSYDPVGNVYSVFDGSGNEAYYFTQDAFGNELPITTLGGSDWNTARADRIVEHQTGKWIDGFTELYYFSARWYDSGVGRFVGRDPKRQGILGVLEGDHSVCTECGLYSFSTNNPISWVDPSGEITLQVCARGKAIRSKPGTHCFLCSGEITIAEPYNNCQGCQIFRGIVGEIHDPKNWYNCMNTEVTECQIKCITQAFNDCCRRYNLISLFTHNCCDCVRAALSDCGLEAPSNVVGVNCGL